MQSCRGCPGGKAAGVGQVQLCLSEKCRLVICAYHSMSALDFVRSCRAAADAHAQQIARQARATADLKSQQEAAESAALAAWAEQNNAGASASQLACLRALTASWLTDCMLTGHRSDSDSEADTPPSDAAADIAYFGRGWQGSKAATSATPAPAANVASAPPAHHHQSNGAVATSLRSHNRFLHAS